MARTLHLSMFIRKKRNKSGSTSIHIVRKDGKKQTHILSIGTAKSEKALIQLEQEALEKLSALQLQSSIDFGYAEDKTFLQNLLSAHNHFVGSNVTLG